MNYPKKPGFNLYQSQHFAYMIYSVKTWFLKNLSVFAHCYLIGINKHIHCIYYLPIPLYTQSAVVNYFQETVCITYYVFICQFCPSLCFEGQCSLKSSLRLDDTIARVYDNDSFGVHSFSVHYLSISEYTLHRGYMRPRVLYSYIQYI